MCKNKIEKLLITCAFVAAFVGTVPNLRAQSVSPDGNGVVFVTETPSGVGNSWVNACSLSAALQSAKSNTAIKQIWVAAGTYKPDYPADGSSTDSRDKSFVLVDSVKMYGGFVGTETTINQRPSVETGRPTSILSGDLDNDGTPSNGDAYHVLVGARVTNNTLLDGFIVTGGNANGTDSIRIGVSSGNTLIVRRYNGGGIYLTGSSPTLANLLIDGNTAKNGGGIYSFDSKPKLINSFITNNTAEEGGGFYADVPPPFVVLHLFTTVPGGYTGSAIITYYNPTATLVVNINAAGEVEYDPSLTVPTGDIKSITLTKPLLGTHKTYPIGRPAPDEADVSTEIKLNLAADGELKFRQPAPGEPIPIGCYAEFQLINTILDAPCVPFKLECNIDLMGVPWEPVGNSVSPFVCTFDGNRKTLSNLFIDKSSAADVGLFGVVGTGGIVKNLGILNGTVKGGGNVGGIAGTNEGTIFACFNTGVVTGTGSNVGGVAGSVSASGSIIACYNEAAVTGDGNNVGGLAGIIDGTMTACYNTGAVKVNGNCAGGVAGYNGGTTNACYNVGAITGTNKRGVVGGGNNAVNCYWLTGMPGGSSGNVFVLANGFDPTGKTGWGTGNGTGPETYWKPDTVNGQDNKSGLTTLPKLFFE
ncbi:hypothetical protein FACS1894199_03520 [Bacteroidia bacterium]|nr:hypothetical protein FACS1894199_03520 [Bacteroidia bacterium]